mmetsp:Transcript_110462/g.330437  ORF Transcript_110462/g.330437 Transcript_110462/m.330437 type:complete len:205 (-) Transcript_110462:65-679(-)
MPCTRSRPSSPRWTSPPTASATCSPSGIWRGCPSRTVCRPATWSTTTRGCRAGASRRRPAWAWGATPSSAPPTARRTDSAAIPPTPASHTWSRWRSGTSRPAGRPSSSSPAGGAWPARSTTRATGSWPGPGAWPRGAPSRAPAPSSPTSTPSTSPCCSSTGPAATTTSAARSMARAGGSTSAGFHTSSSQTCCEQCPGSEGGAG